MARKYSIPSIISNLIYLLFSVFALISINMDIAKTENLPPPESGIDTRQLSIGIMKIVAIFVLIYAGVVLVNLILKSMQAIFDKWGFAIPCILLDVLLLIVNGAVAVSSITEPSPIGIFLGAIMVIAAIWSIVANAKTMVHRNE